MEIWLKWLFWFSVIMIFLITFGYPIFLFLLEKLVRHAWCQDDIEPKVSLIIAAYNEEAIIDQKLKNALSLGYPHD